MFYCFCSTINEYESSDDFIVLTISFISSLKINKVSPFPAQTAPFPLIFLSNLFIALDVKLLTNPGKLSLANEILRSVITFLLRLLNIYLIYLPD